MPGLRHYVACMDKLKQTAASQTSQGILAVTVFLAYVSLPFFS